MVSIWLFYCSQLSCRLLQRNTHKEQIGNRHQPDVVTEVSSDTRPSIAYKWRQNIIEIRASILWSNLVMSFGAWVCRVRSCMSWSHMKTVHLSLSNVIFESLASTNDNEYCCEDIFACAVKTKSVTWRPWAWWNHTALVRATEPEYMWTSSSRLSNYLHRRPIRHTALKQEACNQSPLLIMRNIFFSASEKIISSWAEGSTGPLY